MELDLDLRVGVGRYLRGTGLYVTNRVGAVVDVDFDVFTDHDWHERLCLSEPRISITFDYWDSSHTHDVRTIHDVEGYEELLKFLTAIARSK